MVKKYHQKYHQNYLAVSNPEWASLGQTGNEVIHFKYVMTIFNGL
jgi:hypothetical protein